MHSCGTSAQSKLVRVLSGKIIDFIFNPDTKSFAAFKMENPINTLDTSMDILLIPKGYYHRVPVARR